ncbi:MAG TPA: RNA polymerase sigma factor [Chloroflexia bacterium]|nr:RNA polymerase sigma factor [Chloroflexia bacterium]
MANKLHSLKSMSDSSASAALAPAELPDTSSWEVSDTPALLLAAIKGDVEAFGGLYELYYEKVFRYCAYRVRLRTEAEDLTAEVFLKAWQAIPRYRMASAPFLAWLYRIAHNVLFNYRRKLNQLYEAADSGLDQFLVESILDENLSNNPLKSLIQQSQHRSLYQALTQLPVDQQNVLYFRFVEGLSHNDIAVILDKNASTVRGIQFRALEALASRLNKELFIEE